MKAIDADAVHNELTKLFNEFSEYRALHYQAVCAGISEATRVVMCAPTIDAVPVVHAYWRFRKVREGNHQYICSNCNDSFGFRGDEYDLPKQSFVRKDYRFCRNCGARMDAEKEEPT